MTDDPVRRFRFSDRRFERAIVRTVRAKRGTELRNARFWEDAWGLAARAYREACESPPGVRGSRIAIGVVLPMSDDQPADLPRHMVGDDDWSVPHESTRGVQP